MSAHTWKVLIVDDEPGVHAMTDLNLRNFSYDGHHLDLLHASSAEEAKSILQQNIPIGLALIDVVMENHDSGLQLVNYIRKDLKNNLIRLIIRTGQPGAAPEREVIDNYDIDGYNDKSELTAQKLYSTVRTALKSYHDLMVIEASRRGLEQILSATNQLYLPDPNDIERFFSGILTQIASLCHLDGLIFANIDDIHDGFVATIANKPLIQATIGKYASANESATTKIHQNWGESILKGRSAEDLQIPEKIALVTLKVKDNPVGYIYLESSTKIDPAHLYLIHLMAEQVSTALENLGLRERLQESKRQTMSVLAEISEIKDSDTNYHIRRISQGTELLTLAYGNDKATALEFAEAAILHDLGKLSILDTILNKPGPLDADEYETIKQHPSTGSELLKRYPDLELAMECAASHHERWDGTGYPQGIAGEKIPLIGRIVAVVDAFDALTHQRPYRAACSLEEAVAEIDRHSKTQFDPKVVRAFLQLHQDGKLQSLIKP